jgi:hypothetical protein
LNEVSRVRRPIRRACAATSRRRGFQFSFRKVPHFLTALETHFLAQTPSLLMRGWSADKRARKKVCFVTIVFLFRLYFLMVRFDFHGNSAFATLHLSFTEISYFPISYTDFFFSWYIYLYIIEHASVCLFVCLSVCTISTNLLDLLDCWI